jgi:hypothetical protein
MSVLKPFRCEHYLPNLPFRMAQMRHNDLGQIFDALCVQVLGKFQSNE